MSERLSQQHGVFPGIFVLLTFFHSAPELEFANRLAAMGVDGDESQDKNGDDFLKEKSGLGGDQQQRKTGPRLPFDLAADPYEHHDLFRSIRTS